MPYSDGTLRPWVLQQIRLRCGDVGRVVDVGAGAGQLLEFFKPELPGSKWTAIEIWQPYVHRFELATRYDMVITGDARMMPLPPADVYYFGDVLEHMPRDDAVALWNRARKSARWLVISLPVRRFEQGTVYGNPHEAHLVHWDMDSVREAFPGIVAQSDVRPDLPPYFGDTVAGAFIARGELDEVPASGQFPIDLVKAWTPLPGKPAPLVVAFTVHNRPHYLKQTLATWSRVRGVKDCVFVFSLEPGYPEMLVTILEAQAAGWLPDQIRVITQDEHLGCQANTHAAMTLGFEIGDFVVLAEEDEIVNADIAEYLLWAREAYRDAPDVAVICAHQPYADEGWEHEVLRLSFFFSQGWATWKDRWESFIGPTWDFDYSHGGWDCNLLRVMRERNVPNAVFPARTRTQHIGREGGAHTHPDQFGRTLAQSWEENGFPPGEYREVGFRSSSQWPAAIAAWVPPGPGKPGRWFEG